MKYLILGATGMAGHTIAIYLSERNNEVTAYTRKPFLYCKNILGDVNNLKLLEEVIKNNKFDAVINCVGILNHDAELNQHQAVFINSYLPHYLSNITKNSSTKVIQISTDCVFSGNTGGYVENSFKDGETFYDRSKALGEIDNNKDLTFRNSIIGPDMKKEGIGLFNWFMKQSGGINGYTKAIWTGVTTFVLAKAIEKATKDNLTGIYNLVNNVSISKYDLLRLFNKYFKGNKIIINKKHFINIDKSLINTRKDFDFVIPSYEEMIKEMNEWVVKHKELYSHYFDQIKGN